jgi:hypothetical protein
MKKGLFFLLFAITCGLCSNNAYSNLGDWLYRTTIVTEQLCPPGSKNSTATSTNRTDYYKGGNISRNTYTDCDGNTSRMPAETILYVFRMKVQKNDMLRYAHMVVYPNPSETSDFVYVRLENDGNDKDTRKYYSLKGDVYRDEKFVGSVDRSEIKIGEVIPLESIKEKGIYRIVFNYIIDTGSDTQPITRTETVSMIRK